jgi:hypothetical protein
MIKNLALVAMAAISTAAMAQNGNWQDPNMNSWERNANWVQMHADKVVPGADAYQIATIFDRAPSNVVMALANSLARNTYQAKIMGDEIAWSRMPMKTTYVTTTTNPDGSMTTTATTTTEWVAMARPMRLVMEVSPRNITYDTACEIITNNMSDSEATGFRTWFWGGATGQERDALVAYLEANAKWADQIIYPSTVPSTIWK